jgi:hypothetical protein
MKKAGFSPPFFVLVYFPERKISLKVLLHFFSSSESLAFPSLAESHGGSLNILGTEEVQFFFPELSAGRKFGSVLFWTLQS